MLSELAVRCDREFAMPTNEVILRWGRAELPVVLEEAGHEAPVHRLEREVVTSRPSLPRRAGTGGVYPDTQRPVLRCRGVYIIDGSDDPGPVLTQKRR